MIKKTTYQQVASEIGVSAPTFSQWWGKGAGNASRRAANLISLVWTKKTKGEGISTFVSMDDVYDKEGFRGQIKKIWPDIHDGRTKNVQN